MQLVSRHWFVRFTLLVLTALVAVTSLPASEVRTEPGHREDPVPPPEHPISPIEGRCENMPNGTRPDVSYALILYVPAPRLENKNRPLLSVPPNARPAPLSSRVRFRHGLPPLISTRPEMKPASATTN